MRDDAHQSAAATRLIESSCTRDEPGVVTLVVLCELVWVLDRGYGYPRERVAEVIRKLLSADDLQVERSELSWQALQRYEGGPADFADYVIGLCGREEKASVTWTFDRRSVGSNLFRLVRS